ncbi:hypothetical protein HYY75_05250 [bacterium]|nr:hypothetical protein [bacterium]
MENVLKRAVVLADRLILPNHLPPNFLEKDPKTSLRMIAGSLEEQLMAAERDIILRSLENNKNNISLTANVLKISRRTLQRKMRTLDIEKASLSLKTSRCPQNGSVTVDIPRDVISCNRHGSPK